MKLPLGAKKTQRIIFKQVDQDLLRPCSRHVWLRMALQVLLHQLIFIHCKTGISLCKDTLVQGDSRLQIHHQHETISPLRC